MMECPVQCGCNAHVAAGFFVKVIFNNVDFQLLLTQILHLNLKRVIIQKKELRLEANTWSISIKTSELKLSI